ncbi:serine/threonine-protein kinase 11-interacting protein [Anthonomus grandis grandis]|uniref:serine/threonine-protein kinase 11-interacting protein n=1 Tax=Anthonomus grandis grandis TaxID=2921223 RepID=UPI002165CAFC|nr:serine/threonine-protein kinase 11-interacting protein [Anthonomus grandis grandis]
MSDPALLSTVANLLRPASKEISRGKYKLCLSTIYLNKLNKAFDDNISEISNASASSFHLTDAQASLQIDLQFLFGLVKGTLALKVIPDLVEDEGDNSVNIQLFQKVKSLEIHKINIKHVLGLQKLRSHLEDLICMYSLEDLEDVLDKCGGDSSHHKFGWDGLKRANFSHNKIKDIGRSFEFTPWLQVLDLSHNEIKNLEVIDHLPNLKSLNLSYNKLEKVPWFKLCKRLQVLVLNNNFIEDISGLTSLSGLFLLDLTHNCINHHSCLISISQMDCLYTIDLRGNPIYYHPIHRTLTCNYLNKNTASLNLVLDNIPLTKNEKSLTGSLYPLSQGSLGSNGSHSFQNSFEQSMQDRPKKVRNVDILEGDQIKNIKKKNDVVPSPRSADQGYLSVKNTITKLREEHGDSWLTSQSGGVVQDVLNIPDSPNRTSTPLNKTDNKNEDSIETLKTIDTEGTNNDSFLTCQTKNEDEDTKSQDASIFYSIEKESNSSSSEDEDYSNIFYSGSNPDVEDLCIVVTETQLSERDAVTSKRRARWHICDIKSCQKGENEKEVKIEFDSSRADKRSRIYYIQESEHFVKLIHESMEKNKVPDQRTVYQCIKCSHNFSRIKLPRSVIVDEVITCPKCDSNLVVES